MNKRYYCILPFLSIGLVIGLWIWQSSLPGAILPTPMGVINTIISITISPISQAILPIHIIISIIRVLVAFLVATILGVCFGIILGWNKTFYQIVNPVFELLRPIPPIAWIPLIILWFGIGELSKVTVVFIGCVTPIILNTYTGVKLVDPTLIKAGKSLNMSTRELLWEIILPASTPAIASGMKISFSTGWMCVLAGEMVVAKQGVGFLIIRGMESGDNELIFAGIIVIGLTTMCITTVLNKIERWFLRWTN